MVINREKTSSMISNETEPTSKGTLTKLGLDISHAMLLSYFSVPDMVNLDSACTEKGQRDLLLKAYKDLRSPGFDVYVFKGDNHGFKGVEWAREKDIDLQNLKLEYRGERNRDHVLGKLVMDQKLDMARFYLERNSEVMDAEITDPFNSRFHTYILIEASRHGYTEIVATLLERGANVNKKASFNLETALCAAAHMGHHDTVQLLLSKGADVNQGDKTGVTPLYYATLANHIQITLTLLAGGADVNLRSRYGFSPLGLAASRGDMRILSVLATAPTMALQVDITDNQGRTPLQSAAYAGKAAAARFLLQQGANPTRTDRYGTSPLAIATTMGRDEVVDLLRAAGAAA